MAITYIKTKDGKEYSGPIVKWRPGENWFSIFDLGEPSGDRKFSFDEIESAVTKGERVNIHSPLEGEDRDELERARKCLQDARKYGWDDFTEDTPLFEWEKCA
jgi:hypothetical protein